MRLRPLLICVCLLAASCSSSEGVSVDGLEVSAAAIDAMVESSIRNEPYLDWQREMRRPPIVGADGRATPGFVAGVATNEVVDLATQLEARERGIDLAHRDRVAGRNDASGTVGGRDALAAFPKGVRDRLVDRSSLVAAFERELIGDLTARGYYDDHPDEFRKYCTKDIVVGDRAAAEDAIQRIGGGESFGEVARDVSIDGGTAPKGGDLGCNALGDLVEELDLLSSRLDVGELSEPVETKEGYHVFMVTSRDVPPFSQVKGEADGALSRYGERRLADILARRLREADVEVASKYGRWDARRAMVVLG